MKILQVIDVLNVGGAERVAVDLSNILSDNGVQVSFLSILQKGVLSAELNANIPQIELNRAYRFSISALLRFIHIAKKFDIIHVHMRHNLRYVALAVLLYPTLKKKVVFHDHFGSIDTDNSCSQSLKYTLSCLIKTYIGVSYQLINWAKNNKVSNTHLLPNIVRKQYLENFDQTSSGYVSVGNVRKEKNYEFLTTLASAIPNKSFTIFGKNNIPSYAEKIDKLAGGNMKIIDNVSNVQPELHKYRIAIHCAASETGPLVLIEYLAQGLPFITYRTGEVVAQIQNDLPELIMDNYDIEQWIERIDHIEKNYQSIKDKLIGVFDKNYSEKKYFEQCMTIYKNVLNY